MGEARNTNGAMNQLRKLLLRHSNVDVSDKRRRPQAVRELEREARAKARPPQPVPPAPKPPEPAKPPAKR